MTTKLQSLEAQLVEQCRKHGLSSVSLHVIIRDDGAFFYHSYAHWKDASSETGGRCTNSGNDALTLNKSLAEAIEKANAERAKPVIVPALSPMENDQ